MAQYALVLQLVVERDVLRPEKHLGEHQDHPEVSVDDPAVLDRDDVIEAVSAVKADSQRSVHSLIAETVFHLIPIAELNRAGFNALPFVFGIDPV